MTDHSIVRQYRGAVRSNVEGAYRADALRAARAGYVPMSQTWTNDGPELRLTVAYRSAIVAPDAHLSAEPRPRPQRQQQQAAEPAHKPLYGPVQRIASIKKLQAEDQRTLIAHPETEPVMYRQQAANGSADHAPSDDFARAEATRTSAPFAAVPAVHVVQRDPFETEPPHTPQPKSQATAAAPPQTERYTPPAEMYVAPRNMYVPGRRESPPPADRAPARYTGARRLTVQTMDLHTAGEPLRLIRSGYPDVPLLPVLERRQWVRDNADHIRRALMFEPRGHADMYGAILLPPYNDSADMTVLFMHNEGYSTMCGHGIIAITTGLIEEGLFPATDPVTTIRYEVPAGIVAANAAIAKLDDGKSLVRGVRFTNVPSYLAARSLPVRPDGVQLHGTAARYGALAVDIAFGGAYYGIVNAAELGLRVVPEQADELRRVGAAITSVLRRDHTPAHPTDAALSFVYGTIIVDLDPRTSPDGKATDAHLRNATVFAEAELDRSPCGSGTSAILAQLHARGRLRVGQEIVNAGITGEHFLGRVEAETTLGPYAAVSTSIAGTAYVTGYSTFIVDSRDPLGDGFLLS